LQRKVTKTEYI